MTWHYLLDVASATAWVVVVAAAMYCLGRQHTREALQSEAAALAARVAEAEADAAWLAQVLEDIAEQPPGARQPREMAREALGLPWSDWPREEVDCGRQFPGRKLSPGNREEGGNGG